MGIAEYQTYIKGTTACKSEVQSTAFVAGRSRISERAQYQRLPLFVPRKLSKRLNAQGAQPLSREEVAEIPVKAFSAA